VNSNRITVHHLHLVHDHFGKPVSTFPDYAQGAAKVAWRGAFGKGGAEGESVFSIKLSPKSRQPAQLWAGCSQIACQGGNTPD
jgi:hypothetical protein